MEMNPNAHEGKIVETKFRATLREFLGKRCQICCERNLYIIPNEILDIKIEYTEQVSVSFKMDLK